MATTDLISGKLRSTDNMKAGELADRFGSSRVEIVSASLDLFQRAGERVQRRAIERVRRAHPMPYPRIGRGNKKNRAA